MRKLVLAAAAAAVLSGSFVAASAGNPVAPVDGGTLAQQCYANGSHSLDDPGYKFCRSLQAIEWGAAATCRAPMYDAPDATLPEYCGVFDGRQVSEARIAAYEQSWVHEALTLQRGLDEAAPFWEEQIPHTHNSFNASSYSIPTDGSLPSYYATLTNQDPNQVYSLTDQLRMDIRALELDIHWVPSPYGTVRTGGYWPTLCHGDGEDPTGSAVYVHVGCSDDRPLQSGLAEIVRWLKANPHQVVLIYLENQIYAGGVGTPSNFAHDVTAQLIQNELGSYLYKPPADTKPGRCASMPYGKSQADILAAGKQVMLVGNCGPGVKWSQTVFTRGPAWYEGGNPTTYSDNDCTVDKVGREHHYTFRRWYEESPWLEAMTNATQTLSASTTAKMVRCGANIIGFDQLEPFDGRLKALVWSWAQDQPTSGGGDCAEQGADWRFHVADCSQQLRFACVDSSLDWHVTEAAGPWAEGESVCESEYPGSRFGVPPNGYRNWQLRKARSDGDVWLNYHRSGGTWTPN